MTGRDRSVPADPPLVCVQWSRVLFLHFAVEPAVLRRELPGAFELELHEGRAIVSVVALTKRNFRPQPRTPLWAGVLSLLSEQRLLNLRTYVRYRDEPGAFFFWSWLSRPFGLPLPDRPLGLTCAFATSEYRHLHEENRLQGTVTAGRKRFSYGAQIAAATSFDLCPAESLGEFALERYTGYYWHRRAGFIFRASHPAWLQATVTTQIEHDDLIVHRFPWFREARFLEAGYAPGFDDVWIGRPRPLEQKRSVRRHHHGASSLFEMP